MFIYTYKYSVPFAILTPLFPEIAGSKGATGAGALQGDQSVDVWLARNHGFFLCGYPTLAHAFFRYFWCIAHGFSCSSKKRAV